MSTEIPLITVKRMSISIHYFGPNGGVTSTFVVFFCIHRDWVRGAFPMLCDLCHTHWWQWRCRVVILHRSERNIFSSFANSSASCRVDMVMTHWKNSHFRFYLNKLKIVQYFCTLIARERTNKNVLFKTLKIPIRRH